MQIERTSCLTHSPSVLETPGRNCHWPKERKWEQKAMWDPSSFAQGSAGPFSMIRGVTHRKKPVSLSLPAFIIKDRPTHKIKYVLEYLGSSMSTKETSLNCI